MFASFYRLRFLPLVLFLSGCNVCNVAQTGSGTWVFEGIVDRVFTEGVETRLDTYFRYELEFDYQQANAGSTPGSARYVYKSAFLDVSDENGTMFQVQDLGGSIELTSSGDTATVRLFSTPDSQISGGLPKHAAATSLTMELTGPHESVTDGPLGTGFEGVMPVYLDIHAFDPGLLRVEFGYEGRFIEGAVRTFACG